MSTLSIVGCTPDQDFTAGRESMKQYFNQIQALPDPSLSAKNLTQEITLLGQYVQSEKPTLSSMGQVIQAVPKLTGAEKSQYQQEFTTTDEDTMVVELGLVLADLIHVKWVCANQYVDACSQLPKILTAHEDQAINLASNYETILKSLSH